VLDWANGINEIGFINTVSVNKYPCVAIPIDHANLSRLLDSLSRISAEELLLANDMIAKRSHDVECSLGIKKAEKAMSYCSTAGLTSFPSLEPRTVNIGK
jgi:hypothetical protein